MRSIEQRAKEMGFETSSDPIQPGDIYLAERNSGPKLLICKYVKYTELGDPDWIVPTETAYSFDVQECVKIIQEG